MPSGAGINGWLIWAGVASGALLLLGIVAFIFWWRMTAVDRRTRRLLANISDRLLRDVAIPDGMGGWVVIDALMLRDQSVYVLDLRDMEGAIFGAEKMDQWTIIGRHWRSRFQNPLRFMQDRVLAVRGLLPELNVSGRVLFSARARFPKGRPEGVQLMEEFFEPLTRPRRKSPVELDAGLEIVWQRFCETAEIVTSRRPEPMQTDDAPAGQ